MKLLYLNRADVESLSVPMSVVIESLDRVFKLKGTGRTEMPPKMGVHSMPDAFIHAMPAHVESVATGIKWVSGYPSNIGKGIPYITGLLVLNDPSTGVPVAMMDCSWITAMRTGASAAISARYLARSDSQAAAFLGCGVQARASLHALCEVLPRLKRIHCCDISEQATQRFIGEMSSQRPELEFKAFGNATAMARDADVVVTAIPIVANPQPPLSVGALREGGLAISLDYDAAWTSEAMRQCLFVADDTSQLLATRAHGTYFRGIPECIHADLGELAAGKRAGRSDPAQRIFSMNMGIAIEDMATARLLLDAARSRGVGTELQL